MQMISSGTRLKLLAPMTVGTFESAKAQKRKLASSERSYTIQTPANQEGRRKRSCPAVDKYQNPICVAVAARFVGIFFFTNPTRGDDCFASQQQNPAATKRLNPSFANMGLMIYLKDLTFESRMHK